MTRPITKRQLEVLRAIRAWQRETGLSPTLEELGQELGVNRVTAYGHVQALLQKHYLTNLEPGASRGLDLTPSGEALLDSGRATARPGATTQAADAPYRRLPLLGRIAAGLPLEAVEDREEVSLQDLLPLQGQIYLLRVEGDSMVDAHIEDGDWVLVRRDRVPQPGEVVVAVLPDQTATLKRFYRELDGRYRLQPQNSAHQPLLLDELEVRGVVVGVLRRY